MASKNRKTKGKKWDESSNDDSSDEGNKISKKLKERSFVKREKESRMKQTKKVLSKVCDDDDSDEDKKRNKASKPSSSLQLKISSDSSSDDSIISYPMSNNSEIKKKNFKSGKRKKVTSSSDSDNKTVKKKSKKSSPIEKNSPLTVEKKIRSENDVDHSDSSCSKKFTKPNFRSKSSKLSLGEHVVDDYSIVSTPTRSDDETMVVDKSHEISLKRQILEEIEKLQKVTEEMKASFEIYSDFLMNKKITVVRDSKFVAHKILRIYDQAHDQLKSNRNNFTQSYEQWLDSCSKKKSSNLDESLKKKFKLIEKEAKLSDISKKSGDTSFKKNSVALHSTLLSNSASDTDESLTEKSNVKSISKKLNKSKTSIDVNEVSDGNKNDSDVLSGNDDIKSKTFKKSNKNESFENSVSKEKKNKSFSKLNKSDDKISTSKTDKVDREKFNNKESNQKSSDSCLDNSNKLINDKTSESEKSNNEISDDEKLENKKKKSIKKLNKKTKLDSKKSEELNIEKSDDPNELSFQNSVTRSGSDSENSDKNNQSDNEKSDKNDESGSKKSTPNSKMSNNEKSSDEDQLDSQKSNKNVSDNEESNEKAMSNSEKLVKDYGSSNEKCDDGSDQEKSVKKNDEKLQKDKTDFNESVNKNGLNSNKPKSKIQSSPESEMNVEKKNSPENEREEIKEGNKKNEQASEFLMIEPMDIDQPSEDPFGEIANDGEIPLDSGGVVSGCDSDEIFSADEDRLSKKSQEEESANNLKNTKKLSMNSREKKSKNSESSVDEAGFDTSISEVANTPVKSPASRGSKSLRKTLLCASVPELSDLEMEPNTSIPTNNELKKVDFTKENQSDGEESENISTRTKIDNLSQISDSEKDAAKKKSDSKSETEIRNKNSEVEDESKSDDEKRALSNLLADCKNGDSDESSNVTDIENSSEDDILKKKINKVSPSETKKNNNKFPKIQIKSKLTISSDSSSDVEEKESSRKTKRAISESDDNNDGLSLKKHKRIAFNIRKNRFYKADKKLRMECVVEVEQLSRRVLKKHAKALEKSKKYLANKKFNSITNIDGLENKKKSKKNLDNVPLNDDSPISTKAKMKSKKVNDDKEIENVEEDNGIASDSEEIDHEVNNDVSMLNDVSHEEEVMDETENFAKEALLKSCSSSENEEKVEKNEKKKPIKIKVKKINKDSEEMEVLEVKSNDEESESEQIDKEKSKWKEDELLALNVTDSEAEEQKLVKSLKKKKKKSKEESDESIEEIKNDDKTPTSSPTKRPKRQRKKKRVLDSDSDAKLSSSDEESVVSEKGSDYEEESKEKKKKSKKRKQQSSDSDSSNSDQKPKTKRKRIKKVASDSDDDQESPGKGGRKNIRKLLKDKYVADDTKKAAMDEEERLKRIAERQRLFNEMYESKLAGEAKVDKLVLDIDEESKTELVAVDKELVKRLKPHQAQGIKFMWDACFESLKQIEKSEGSGCIIAHCMGLGKTFQVVTLSHTLLSHDETNVRTVMIVCPLSTVLNWVNEFKMWLKHTKDGDDIEIYEMTKAKKNIERKYQLESWQKTGGVLIIGYEMFRNLTSGTGKKMRKAMQESINRSLVDPGADLVVCDEGHLLKNEDSALSKAMKLVKTKRRIVLTGTPLQNNLKEYHCMVQFVKPNLLGTKKEFLNRFVNPITNGQFDDSTPFDVKLMKKRAHVLHKMLEGSVQRFDYSVLTPFLPPKQEYVIFVRLHEVQIKMYQHYLDNFARRSGGRNGSLFSDFQELQRIWTHPYVLRLNAEKVDKANEKKRLEASDSEGSLKDFIDDDSESDSSSVKSSSAGSNSDVQCLDSDEEKPTSRARSTRLNPKDEPVEEIPSTVTTEEAAWWSQYLEESHFQDLRISSKLQLLFGILKESEQIGDKVLVFSQSLYSLTLIEYFLNLIDNETQNDDEELEYLDGHSGKWQLGLDYFRLDGSTNAENRSLWCKIFNNPKNTRARLFLISTRAGGLGINLTAANRVIIFDASWNPSHDVQSIFRIYRFGQRKPCYVYRFLAAGTMEEKIYNRQVTKLSLACRVVDEQQIERHYSNNDLAELYQFETYEGQSNTLNLPKDRLLAEIFLKYKDRVWTYHEHDSLLENKQEEELDEEERKQAWLEYEEEKQGKRQMMVNTGNNMLFNQMLMNMNSFPEMENIKLLIQKDYPNLPPEHLETVARQAMYDMYRYVDQQAINPYGMFGGSMQQFNLQQPQYNQQQHTYNVQNQLMNMQQQMNYAASGGLNQMPAYSGRGRPPKHLSMQNQMMMNMNNPAMNMNMNMNMNSLNNINNMGNISLNQMAAMQPSGGQMPQLSNNSNNEVQVIEDDSMPSTNDAASTNNVQEK